MWESALGPVFPPVTVLDAFIKKIGDLKFWQLTQKKNKDKKARNWSCCLILVTFFMCYWWYNLHPPTGDCGKVPLCLSTHPNSSERVALGCCWPLTNVNEEEAVSSHCSGGINLSGICWESGGNLLDPVLFTGQFIPCVAKRTFWYLHPVPFCSTILPPPHEDALMIKLFLVCLYCLSLEMSTSALSSRLAFILCLFY